MAELIEMVQYIGSTVKNNTSHKLEIIEKIRQPEDTHLYHEVVPLVVLSQIFGRAIKNEYLSLAVLSTAFGGAYLATRGGDKAQAKPTNVQQAKESVKVEAGSSEEERFIQNFIAEAEKESAGAAAAH
ncbi:hypothetical protein BJ165DRAFT_1520481 [Panaeolus papilionaceus]|nr:hypothetical protein BJ165DRAFT_1520481 [Panaeolus papilionaceus]